MQRRTSACRATRPTLLSLPALGLLCALAIPLAGRIAGNPTAEEAPPQDEVAALCAAVLANPLDAAAVAKLEALRDQQRKQREAGLLALGKGLRAYLGARWPEAAEELKTAAACPEASDLAKAHLTKPLAEVLRACEAKAKALRPAPAQEKRKGICERCGNTGWMDCPQKGCVGSGSTRCERCRGQGYFTRQVRDRSGFGMTETNIPCPACKGTGADTCEKCRGRGVVPCTCGARPVPLGKDVDAAEASAAGVAPKEAAAARTVIAMARYLRSGGIDLDSRDAFKRSPAVAGGPAQ